MLIQRLLDNLSYIFSLAIDLLPTQPPVEVQDSMDATLAQATALGNSVAALGAVVPFDVIATCFSLWLGCLTFMGVMLGIRFVLWAFNR